MDNPRPGRAGKIAACICGCSGGWLERVADGEVDLAYNQGSGARLIRRSPLSNGGTNAVTMTGLSPSENSE